MECASTHPVGLCNWDHFKCKGAGPLHKCAYCRRPQMHPACHAAFGLPDGVHSVAQLPEALRGIAPTCNVFCQLCGINEVLGTGAKTKEVMKMERLWKQKMTRIQKEIKAYKVTAQRPRRAWPLFNTCLLARFCGPCRASIMHNAFRFC